jgi:cell division septal protein FtsQ
VSIVKLRDNKGLRKKISIFRAMVWILISTILISGSVYFSYFYYTHLVGLKKSNSKYSVVALVQSSPSNELLQSEYLAEQLGLSIDKPTNLYAFDVKRGKQHLLRSPLIQLASIRKVSPGTLFIDYNIRKPMAFLGDFSNTAIDKEGVLIPFKPFFTPKTLPVIFFGSRFFDSWKQGLYWGHSVKGKKLLLALKIIQYFEKEQWGTLALVDLSHMKSDRLGEREIVLKVNKKKQLYLRLSAEHPIQCLDDFKVLYRSLQQRKGELPKTVDLRIKHLAFISE